jgi:hypothetical protein
MVLAAMDQIQLVSLLQQLAVAVVAAVVKQANWEEAAAAAGLDRRFFMLVVLAHPSRGLMGQQVAQHHR